MESEDTLRKLRTPVRSRLTRLLNEVKLFYASEPSTEKAEEAKAWAERITIVMDELRILDASMRPFLGKLDPEKVEEAINRQLDYAEAVGSALVKLRAFGGKCESLETSINKNAQSIQGASANAGSPFWLPASTKGIPQFFGDHKKFRGWFSQFDILVHKAEMPVIQKFKILKDCLSGPAARCISDLDLDPGLYNIAIGTIKARYGNSTDAEDEHIREIMDICKRFNPHHLQRPD